MAQLRARGKRAFIWRVGILGWGLTVLLLTLLWSAILQPLLTGADFPSAPEVALRAVIGAPIWAIGGYLFGLWMWKRA